MVQVKIFYEAVNAPNIEAQIMNFFSKNSLKLKLWIPHITVLCIKCTCNVNLQN